MQIRSITADTRVLIPLLVIAALLMVAFIAIYLPTGIDWRQVYRPAAQALVTTGRPYDVPTYRNPPWALIPLIPIAFLPLNISYGVMVVVSLAAFGYSAYKLGANPAAFTAFLLSPPVLHSLLHGQNDWMPVLGFVLPPQIGLFFVVVKPQMGAMVAVFWLIESWRNGGLREVFRVFWPVTAATLLSFVLFGFWLVEFAGATDLWWNASLWPASIPIGLALMVAATRKRRIEYSMAASPCLSPYVLLHAWSGALIALASAPAEMVAAVVGLWILVVFRAGILPAF